MLALQRLRSSAGGATTDAIHKLPAETRALWDTLEEVRHAHMRACLCLCVRRYLSARLNQLKSLRSSGVGRCIALTFALRIN